MFSLYIIIICSSYYHYMFILYIICSSYYHYMFILYIICSSYYHYMFILYIICSSYYHYMFILYIIIICSSYIEELNIVVSLFQHYGQSFRESCDCWSCDILRSKVYPLLEADTSRRGPLSFVSICSSSTCV